MKTLLLILQSIGVVAIANAQYDHLNTMLMKQHMGYAGSWGDARVETNVTGHVSPNDALFYRPKGETYLGFHVLSKHVRGGLGGYVHHYGSGTISDRIFSHLDKNSTREAALGYAPKFTVKDRWTISPAFHAGILVQRFEIKDNQQWVPDYTKRYFRSFWGAGFMLNGRAFNLGYQLRHEIFVDQTKWFHSILANVKLDRNSSNNFSSTIGFLMRTTRSKYGFWYMPTLMEMIEYTVRYKQLRISHGLNQVIKLGMVTKSIDFYIGSSGWASLLNRTWNVGATIKFSKGMHVSKRNGLLTRYK